MDDFDRRYLGLASLLEQVTRQIYDLPNSAGLLPAQWAALRFFERAGEQARTVSGLAAYLGNTKGPASRTARALERRGFLFANANPDDGRSVVFSLTESAIDLLREDPQHKLALVLADLPEAQLACLQTAVISISKTLLSQPVRL